MACWPAGKHRRDRGQSVVMAAGRTEARSLRDLETPCLVVDRARMRRNVARLAAHLAPFGVPLRPHLKTVKSVEAARLVMAGPTGPACVSTLQEAEQFGAAGVTDLLYAVGISPQKLIRVGALRARGIDLKIVVDNVEAAEAVAAFSRASGDRIPTLIEVDCDGHRAGVPTTDAGQLVAIGRALHEGGAALAGVLTHAGESYSCVGREALEAMAEQERARTVASAEILRGAGLPAPMVSIGSTPTAFFTRKLDGVTEVRAGVYPFFDLFMTGLGVCQRDDVALSVLTTVTGHQRDKGWILVDAGWMAMSRDRGTARQKVDQGYGLGCDLAGRHYPDLVMVDAHQEHGVLAIRRGSTAPLPDLRIGDMLRILPNHACATGAQHDGYVVVDGASDRIEAWWPRFRGW
jgi:D-serine deaminase-like pyridoxal phosphate-dependent protein